MVEAIQQNPIISLLIILVPVIAAVWKIMDVLYVKPRDFRISVLENNIEEIRKKIQQTEITEINAVVPDNVEPHATAVTDTLEKLEKIVESTSLLNDIDLFYDSWKDEKFTDLQRDQFEKNFKGQKVVWKATFSSVSEERDGYLWVSLTSPTEGKFGVHVIAVFDSNYKEALLMVNKDEIVTVSGVIDSFSLAPLIRKCNITKNT